MPPEGLQDALRAAAPDADVDVTVLPSGSFDVTVRRPDGALVVMQGRPSRNEYGLTPGLLSESPGGFDGRTP